MNLNNDFKVGTQVPSLKPISFLFLSDEKGAKGENRTCKTQKVKQIDGVCFLLTESFRFYDVAFDIYTIQ